MKRDKVKKVLFIITKIIATIILVLSTIAVFFTDNDEYKSRLVFNGLMALVLLILTFLPLVLEKAFKVDIPSIMEIIFLVFSVLSFLLGEIGDFYIKFKWWDSMLHAMSGVLLGCVGFVLLNFFNKNDNFKSFHLGPGFAALFVLCFTITCGTLWEVIEYIADTINGTNMQRFQDNITGEGFIGRAALFDTMKDLILDSIGGVFIAIIGYLDIKFDRGLVNKLKVEIVLKDNSNGDD